MILLRFPVFSTMAKLICPYFSMFVIILVYIYSLNVYILTLVSQQNRNTVKIIIDNLHGVYYFVTLVITFPASNETPRLSISCETVTSLKPRWASSGINRTAASAVAS